MKRFSDLTEQEVLALAITNEEEDSRIYRSFAERLRPNYAASAKMFDEMAEEEVHHRTALRKKVRRAQAGYQTQKTGLCHACHRVRTRQQRSQADRESRMLPK